MKDLTIGQKVFIVRNGAHHHFFVNEQVKILDKDEKGYYVSNDKQYSWVLHTDVSMGESKANRSFRRKLSTIT